MEERRYINYKRKQLYDGKPAEVQYYDSTTKKRLKKIENTPSPVKPIKRRNSISRSSSFKNENKRSISAKKFQAEILGRMNYAEQRRMEKLGELRIELEREKMKEVKSIPKNTKKAEDFLKRMQEDINEKKQQDRGFEVEKKVREERIRKESEELKNCTFNPNYNKSREKRRSSSKRCVERLLDWRDHNRRLKIELRHKYHNEEDRKIDMKRFKSSTGGSAKHLESPQSNWQELGYFRTPERNYERLSQKRIRKSSENLNTQERFKSSNRNEYKGKKYITKPPVYQRERKFQNKTSQKMTRGYLSRYSKEYLSNREIDIVQVNESGEKEDKGLEEQLKKIRKMRRSVEIKYLNSSTGSYTRVAPYKGRNSNSKLKAAPQRSRSNSKISERKKELLKQRVEDKKKKIRQEKKPNEKEEKEKPTPKIKKDKKKKKKRAIKYVRPEHKSEKNKKQNKNKDTENLKFKTKIKKTPQTPTNPEVNNFEAESFNLSNPNSQLKKDTGQNLKSQNKLFEEIEILKQKRLEEQKSFNKKRKKSSKLSKENLSQEEYETPERRPKLETGVSPPKPPSDNKLRNSLNRLHESILMRSVNSKRSGTPRKSLQKLRKGFEQHLKRRISNSREKDSSDDVKDYWMGAKKY